MNLLIAFVILLVLLVSEMGNNQPVDDVWLRLTAIMLTTFMVPMLAAFQTVIVTRRLKSDNCDLDKVPNTLKRLTACHSAVWLVASLAIVYSFQWQKIVRGNWNLDRWWLIDDLLIIAPVVLSLVASWAIFFDIQTVFAKSKRLKGLSERFKFVGLRVRVYLAIFMVPMLFTIAARDIFDSHFVESTTTWMIGISIGLPLLLATFPFLVLFVWQTQPIQDQELHLTVRKIVTQHHLKVARVRVWTTSRQIINAVVAGVFPYFRVILISDGVVKNFSSVQVSAILRHEAGHIRRWHLLSRIFFIVLPILIVLIAESLGYHLKSTFEGIAAATSLPLSFAMPTMTAIYCLYLLVVLVWLSKLMEYDADQYSVTQLQAAKGDKIICEESLASMESALVRFAELMPSQVDRKSMWHPTVRERLNRLQQLRENPQLLEQRAADFIYHQFLLLCLTLVMSTLFFVVTEFGGL